MLVAWYWFLPSPLYRCKWFFMPFLPVCMSRKKNARCQWVKRQLLCVWCWQRDELEHGLPDDSVFYKLGENGLISFTDYVFLLVVLSSMYCIDLPVQVNCIDSRVQVTSIDSPVQVNCTDSPVQVACIDSLVQVNSLTCTRNLYTLCLKKCTTGNCETV